MTKIHRTSQQSGAFELIQPQNNLAKKNFDIPKFLYEQPHDHLFFRIFLSNQHLNLTRILTYFS